MIILLASPDAFDLTDKRKRQLAKVFIDTRSNKNPTAIISNRKEPDWFESVFDKSNVQFVRSPGRQSGEHLKVFSDQFNLQPHETLVVAHSRNDVAMGKNGGAVLLGASWSGEQQVQSLGIQIRNADELREIIALTQNWDGDWWYSASAAGYEVRVLGDLSTYYKPADQEKFGTQLTQTVKNGGPKLNALLALTARSALIEGLGDTANTLWGTYPSSNSSNNDSEVLSDFCHRLRTTVSNVRFCSRGKPLFIRHIASRKRSGGGVANREDPAEQLETIHINPYYISKGRLRGRNVVLLDDCMTNGTSFGVAAALLKAANASSVTCIALGKFGNKDLSYEIDVTGDPSQPLTNRDYSVKSISHLSGTQSKGVQQSLIDLLK